MVGRKLGNVLSERGKCSLRVRWQTVLNAAERLGKMKTRHWPLELMTLVTLGELLHGFVREIGVGLRGMREMADSKHTQASEGTWL